MLGVAAANCKIFTEAALVWVLCGQIHMSAFRAILATRAARALSGTGRRRSD
jgi:hypothetical protein